MNYSSRISCSMRCCVVLLFKAFFFELGLYTVLAISALSSCRIKGETADPNCHSLLHSVNVLFLALFLAQQRALWHIYQICKKSAFLWAKLNFTVIEMLTVKCKTSQQFLLININDFPKSFSLLQGFKDIFWQLPSNKKRFVSLQFKRQTSDQPILGVFLTLIAAGARISTLF